MNVDPMRSRVVVDASVVIKWHVNEVHSEAACRYLADDAPELYIPDLVFPEVGNILWKKVRRGELTPDRAREVAHLVAISPLMVRTSAQLMEAALEIALNTGRSVYDSLYVALAVSLGCRMVTADRKLFNSLIDGPLAPHLLWVEDGWTEPIDLDEFEIPGEATTHVMSAEEKRFAWFLGFGSENAADSDLQEIGSYPTIKHLFLNTRKVSDRGIGNLPAKLKQPEDLQILDLKGSAVTDAGLVHLRGLTGLRNLNLAQTEVTDAGLEHLQDLVNLEKLNLWETAVSDAGLRLLRGLVALRELDLEGTRVTEAGIAELRAALPSLVIKS